MLSGVLVWAMEAWMDSFAGKVALVTGGSSGIGKAAAIAFARSGANVVIAARGEQRGTQTVDEITAAGGKAIFVPTDVSRSADVKRLVARTVEAFGRLDYAFNNAANPDGSIGLLADLTDEDFDKSVSINLKSVWLGMKYEIRQMLAQEPRGGAIVNTSSANGLGGCPQASFYAAAKAGVIALSKSAAWEYAQQGVRINALVPGAFRTPMLEGSIDRAAAGEPEARQAVEAKWNSMIASGRIGDPAEAAAAVLWLCSDASSYVVGHSLIVDGGITALWR
jgi:NAD(P)-dependent dehydrogenase (short-subunit alcohol dehydrogenase family)